ncbi:MAG: hypothetical protein KF824_07590 [Fimbriimonadaceae bacterium]|nr:MAG: hypothetical protein KF824_07590 [Fimbriimonadaceae bacterium]
MKLEQIMKNGLLIAGLIAVLALGGCKTDPEPAPPSVTGSVNAKVKDLYRPEAQAGTSLDLAEATKDMDTVRQIAERRSWNRRGDAFSLLAAERTFEQQQQLENLLSQTGGFMMEHEPPDPNAVEAAPQRFPVPNWRLAGVVVSEGAIIALLDQGTRVDTIVPGQTVEGTEWRCISIDTEKAVFRRDPSRLPDEITVPLQGTLPGVIGGGNAPAGGGNSGRGGRGPSGGDEGGR